MRPEKFHRSAPSSRLLALDWLSNDTLAGSLLATAKRLLAAEALLEQILPHALAQHCKVIRIENGEIRLAVPSAAYASKLRQLGPRLISQLNQSGWNLNQIKVQVQAKNLLKQDKIITREVEPLSEPDLKHFDHLRETLPPGPLHDAISRLLKRHHYF